MLNFAATDPNVDFLLSEMRCDKALELIIDNQSTTPTWLNESETSAVSRFLLGFGMLSANETPESPEVARGAAIGGLMAFCQDAPSRTIMEIAARYFR